MQKDNRFLDDLAKMASQAAGEIVEMKQGLDEMARLQIEKLLQNMNYPSREEYQTLLEMQTKIREEQEKFAKRLDALEKRLEGLISK
ncbi:MAG: accessory factor UbiK family protein [Rickettsiales bacterium]|nr:accessory factor UbiK family protein [Rickettsiales bacterium]